MIAAGIYIGLLKITKIKTKIIEDAIEAYENAEELTEVINKITEERK